MKLVVVQFVVLLQEKRLFELELSLINHSLLKSKVIEWVRVKEIELDESLLLEKVKSFLRLERVLISLL